MAPENRKFILISTVAAVVFCLFLGLGLGLGHKANATKNTTITTTTTTTTTTIPALIITGGRLNAEVTVRTVEVFVPATNTTCSLPSLPEKTAGHTQDGLSQCGGYGSEMFCQEFSQGEWRTQNLSQRRVRHTSWRTGTSLFLMGGMESNETTEEIADGVTRESFELAYETDLACSIPDIDSVIITGGLVEGRATAKVARYTMSTMDYLASLNTPRFDHACAGFTTDSGSKVYLVMGGTDVSDNHLTTTEQLTEGQNSWELITALDLPRPLTSVRAVTISNIVYLTGGRYGDGHMDEIYRLEPDIETGSWVEVGKMREGRFSHGVSLINYSEVEQFCTAQCYEEDQFTCRDSRKCIEKSLRCNQSDDCDEGSGGSDEVDCS